MLTNLPLYNNIIFILTALMTVFIFYRAVNGSKLFLLIMGVWMVIQGILGITGVYTVADGMPPRFVLSAAPQFIFILIIFFSKKGKAFFEDADLRWLTIIHIVRIPVELMLHELYLHKAIPQLMTYEGRNFDILSGMTAPIIYYLAFMKKNMGRTGLLIWNLFCLCLLVNIVVNAALSAPFSFQQFGFEQPNIAVLYFPFVWLPFCIVPLVFLAHLVSIRRLLQMRE